MEVNKQNLKLVKGFVDVLESLPKDTRTQIFNSFFGLHTEELEELDGFYLDCKKIKKEEDWLSAEEHDDFLNYLAK
ncbi:hypothetical protein QUF74_08875 [Candidatus Halobeggiatoa sp. HSG11]|nr:hypothetical protein [Candidatus Halobeggiatoa sp. HSG11]